MSEEMIIRHCSPTLAGIKTGSLFRCSIGSARELREELRRLNRRLARKGIRFLPLRIGESDALIYVYRPSLLAADLRHQLAGALLKSRGYDVEKPAGCIARLTRLLCQSGEFPHEIGLFLGYPPEDVDGFIHRDAADCKLCGMWKVYGDADAARKLFERYGKCTRVYLRQHASGRSIDRLTVAAQSR